MNANTAGIFLGLFVVILTIVLLILIRKRSRKEQRLTAGDVLQLLNEIKHIRLDAGKRWKLHEIIGEHRVWSSLLGIDDESSGLLTAPILLYGCFHRVKASTQDVLTTLSSTSKYAEWDPDFGDVRIISPAQESKIDGTVKSQQTSPVKHDIISARSHFVANRIIQWLNAVSSFLQGVPFVQRRKTVYRGRDGPARAPYKMTALANSLLHQKLKCAPLLTLTLPSTNPTEDATQPVSSELTDSGQASDNEKFEAKLELKTTKSEPSFIQKFKKMVEDKKEQYEREKSLKKRRMEALAAAHKDTVKDILHHSVEAEINPEGKEDEQIDDEEGSVETEEEEDVAMNISTSITSSTEDTYKDKKASIMNLFSKGTKEDVKPVQWSDHVKQRLKKELNKVSKSLERSGEMAVSVEGITLPDDEDKIDASTPLLDRKSTPKFEIEPVSREGIGERHASFKTQAGRIIEDIMVEKSRISQINISLSPEDQAANSGGWIYSSLDKDIVILKKAINEDALSPVFSYLGKGIIDCHPQKVFEKLQNPHTRFTYDEQLKKTEVLQDLGNGLKIVYMYHELGQIFKREGHELCVLQCERHRATQDSGLSTYALGMESVYWPELPQNEEVLRSKLLPSGWIVEPITKGDNIQSMVTYVINLETTHGQGVTALEELASKQPTAIAALRQYLTPPPISPQASLKASSSFSNLMKVKKRDDEPPKEKEAVIPQTDVMC
ncbi:hypothetical protein CAPTEDRAFT_198663 [Capitella teleta]|uniref:START domain-containing protein n=1 Tax=Capitella teleta TaxID=283909 RepID=R7V2Z7_CAPTE|nr:hypothetical protein CAPTEDRAFT_198663 [Capitella teleta]|eukprot:ELU12867.1 hypothetical protein CAPTEDRAFT_198663 [Capitella teleta]